MDWKDEDIKNRAQKIGVLLKDWQLTEISNAVKKKKTAGADIENSDIDNWIEQILCC